MAGGGNPQQVTTADPRRSGAQFGPVVNQTPQVSPTPAPSNVFQGAAGNLGAASQAATGAAQFQPGSLAATNLAPFQNPFQQQVINPTLADIERQRMMAINDVGAAATGAGAFGGARQGIAEAETNRAALEAAARASGQLRSQGFQQAQSAAQQDIANQLAGRGLNLNAAGTLGNLANLGFGFGQQINQQQMQQGTMQQALMQQLIDAARGQFAGFTGSPLASTQAPLQALGAVPFGQTETTSQQPGLFNFLSLGLGLL